MNDQDVRKSQDGITLPQDRNVIADLLAKGVGYDGVDRVLKIVRKHMGMDVAFVAHFRETDRVFEHVDSEGDAPIKVGQSIPLQDGYCLKVARGELPEFIPNTADVPATQELPETKSVPIGAHISVPIRLDTGEVYGTLCCFSYISDSTLNTRDLKMMRAFSEVLASHIDTRVQEQRDEAKKVALVRHALSVGVPRMVYQPVFNIRTGSVVGAEALSRFDVQPTLPPNEWFNLAHEAGLGYELELLAIERAVASLPALQEPFFLCVNSSPELIVSGRLAAVLEGVNLHRVVMEITEHMVVEDYDSLHEAFEPLRARGMRLAIDDAGAGYSSMRHIVNLRPEFIKLDMSLTRDIDKDPHRRALARAMIAYSHDVGSIITAEGVETEAELRTLQSLGVDKAQGFYLGRPVGLAELQRLQESCPPVVTMRVPVGNSGYYGSDARG
ncbi:MAG TPA: EAL domain-containing protein [Acidobacteriaceae bacterium]